MFLFSEYVHHAIKKIFSLYKKADVKPKTIVLVGHSMVSDLQDMFLGFFYPSNNSCAIA